MGIKKPQLEMIYGFNPRFMFFMKYILVLLVILSVLYFAQIVAGGLINDPSICKDSTALWLFIGGCLYTIFHAWFILLLIILLLFICVGVITLFL